MRKVPALTAHSRESATTRPADAMPAPTYVGILTWLKTARLNDFQCQNRQLPLFEPQPEQWSVKKARAFVKALQEMWGTWG